MKKNAREVSSILGGDAGDINGPIKTTYTIENAHELKIECLAGRRYYERFGDPFHLDLKTIPARYVFITRYGTEAKFYNLEECELAQEFKYMLRNKLISKIIVTYRPIPAELLDFDVYK